MALPFPKEEKSKEIVAYSPSGTSSEDDSEEDSLDSTGGSLDSLDSEDSSVSEDDSLDSEDSSDSLVSSLSEEEDSDEVSLASSLSDVVSEEEVSVWVSLLEEDEEFGPTLMHDESDKAIKIVMSLVVFFINRPSAPFKEPINLLD